ncbi:MAG: TolC family protein [Bacteroidales bacterium]|nr:TolC family protein [Bacteroidales bacterium]MCF8326942.1 TolC family protein [Bacteroidales bacterium]
MIKKHSILLLFILPFSLIINAQNTDTTEKNIDYSYVNLTEEGIENHLPPLQTLIDSAISNSPLLKYKNSAEVISALNTKSVRKEWSKYIGVISDVKYGLFDNLVLGQDDDGNLNTGLVSTTQQTRYSAGIYLKLPLQELIDRRNKIKIAEEEEKMAEYEYQQEKKELRKLVIQQYNDLLLYQKLLKIKNDYVQDVLIQKQMAEKQFKDNEIDISELTRLSSMHSKALSEYESAKADFNNAYMMLQEIVGMKFKLKIRKQQ